MPLARLVAGNVAKGEPPLPDADLIAETLLIMVAGTDTTATSLTYLFFELARRPEWYARVRAEVSAAVAAAAADTDHDDNNDNVDDDADGVEGGGNANGGTANGTTAPPPPRRTPLTYAAVQALPVLNAVVWETLRMYPALPAAMPREAPPPDGALVAGAGVWLPAGTTVAAQSYTVQRNADVFPQPDEWRPERWLALAAAPSVPLPPVPSWSPSLPTLATEATDAVGVEDIGGGGGKPLAVDAHSSDDEGRQPQYAIYENDDMRAHMLVFGRGARACLGRNIALVELKLATAALAQRFGVVRQADRRQTVRDMRITDRFVLVPHGKRCLLVFE